MQLSDAVYERLLAERTVVIGTDIDDAMANRVTAQLLFLAAEDPVADITLLVNSRGGSVTAGMAIFDTIEAIEPAVRTQAVGLAAGMAQFLVTSGAPGKRCALGHAKFCLTRPTTNIDGTPNDQTIQAEVHQKWADEIARVTAGQTGQSVEQVIMDANQGRWFTAPQACEYGLVDQIVEAVVLR